MSKGREPTVEEEAEDRAKLKELTASGHFDKPVDYFAALKQNKRILPEKFSLKLDNYIQNVEQFYELNPFFFDKTGMFWLYDQKEYKYERTDDTEMLNLIDTELGFFGQTVTGGIKNNYLEAFRRVGRKHLPKPTPSTWIQFKNKIIDIKTNEEIPATHEYFITNPIPWEIGTTEDTPTIDRLFHEWQNENKHILYEILAYCILPDYPIHIIIANIGTGRNGKSQYTKIIEKFIGKDNTTSAELDSLIKERFESAKLHKKLVCLMGETNFGMMSQTSLLKKLCGGDLISYEYKNKMPFTDVNYAKIIINTNNLPASGDTTDGFYRRWLILSWLNNFDETGIDIYKTIPDHEYPCLARKCLRILKELLKRGKFTTQGTIEDRKEKYIKASNPISIFLMERCEIGDTFFVKAKDLYHEYTVYLRELKRRVVKRKEFNQILAEEGYQAEHTQKKVNGDFVFSYWFDGLKLKEVSSNSSNSSEILPSLRVYGNNGENQEEKEEKEEKVIAYFEDLGEIAIKNDFFNFESILAEKTNREIAISRALELGFSEEQINQWKSEGLIFEPKNGVVKLL